MNINAIEMMSLNQKNMKFGMKATPTPTEPQAPVTQPNYGMNGLEAQANSNIAFQGLMAKAGKRIMPYMMGLMVLGGAAGLQSCDKYMEPDTKIVHAETNINSTVNVTIDMSAITEMMAEFRALIDKLSGVMDTMNATLQQFYAKFSQFVADYQAGKLDDAAFKQAVLDLFKQSNANQETMIGLTTQQNAQIAEILAKFGNGELTLDEAFDQLMAILGSINNGIHALLAEAQSAHQDYKDKMDEANTYLQHIDYNTYNIDANTKILTQYVKDANDKLGAIKAGVDSLLAHSPELKDLLVQIHNDQIKAPLLEEILATAGVTVTQAMAMSTEELKAIIQKGINTYVTYETKKIKIMEFIRDNMPQISENPELGAKLTQIVELLNSIDAKDAAANDKLQAIYDKLDAILNNLGCVDCCDEVIELLKEIAAKSHEGVLD